MFCRVGDQTTAAFSHNDAFPLETRGGRAGDDGLREKMRNLGIFLELGMARGTDFAGEAVRLIETKGFKGESSTHGGEEGHMLFFVDDKSLL